MKRHLLLILSLFFISGFAFAQVPQPDMTLKLYPQGQNADSGIVEKGVVITQGPFESNGLNGIERSVPRGWIFNIGDDARINLYLPEHPNGQMVIVCPGGGYEFVSSLNEGQLVAKWLKDNGIAVCVLYYRLPNKHHVVPLIDVQNAFRYCRFHAAEWGVNQIGIMGFSAGGHLAAYASNLYVDNNTRPDFTILVYPVITLEKEFTHIGTRNGLVGDDEASSVYYSMENRVTENTPPTLICLSADDETVHPINSLRYFSELQKNKVEVQMNIFPSGGHGFGFTTSEFGTDALEPHRKLFFDCILHFLHEIHDPES